MKLDLLPEPEAPELAEDTHRPGPGWTLLVLMLSLWIGMGLWGYFDRKPDAIRATKFRNAEAGARSDFLFSEAFRRLGTKNAKPVPTVPTGDLGELLKKQDANAEMLWYAVGKQSGLKPDPTILTRLSKSSVTNRRAFSQVYLNPPTNQTEAEQRIEKLPESFAGRLAAVQAYRSAGVPDPERRVFSDAEAFGPMLLGLVILLGGVAGCLLWVVYFAMRVQGKIVPVGHPSAALSAADADRFAWRAATLMLLMFFGPLLLFPLKDTLPAPVFSILVYGLLIGGSMYLIRKPAFGRAITLRQLGWRRDRVGADALWGMGAAMANVPILFVVIGISSLAFKNLPPPEHPATVTLSNSPDIWVLIGTFLAASIAAPILEETMFRGLIVPAMIRATGGLIGGWIVGGILFAAVHPTGIPAWLALATVGAMGAAVNHQTGSLVSSVFMHAVHNAAILTLSLVMLG